MESAEVMFQVARTIQVGSNSLGESDKDLVQTILHDKHVVGHPDRLCQLNRRFFRPKTKATRVGVEKRKNPRAGALDDNAPRASSLPSTEPNAHAQCAVDVIRDFTDVVLRLEVVAKFLGYHRLAPQWHVSFSNASRADENAAFQALEQQGTETLERVHDAHVDVKH
ncbi:hypothetical protein PsorP6_013375 [Peronosclerospora sorghi]|uniref:Uncharacterized protein n=1 Tax=Peronosclerospora sorghi TaxID=230839 RepID=A0ACC0WG47_9STRA|nr:hypothetical protein PsorP6_013375 [Peronosclerospora sorghi]